MALDRWVWLYNNDYPHSSIGYATPCEYETNAPSSLRGEHSEYKNSLIFGLTGSYTNLPYKTLPTSSTNLYAAVYPAFPVDDGILLNTNRTGHLFDLIALIQPDFS